jgi:hypothetical protein
MEATEGYDEDSRRDELVPSPVQSEDIGELNDSGSHPSRSKISTGIDTCIRCPDATSAAQDTAAVLLARTVQSWRHIGLKTMSLGSKAAIS